MHVVDAFPGRVARRAHWPAWSLQLLRRAAAPEDEVVRRQDATIAWAGSIWRVGSGGRGDEARRCCEEFTKALWEDRFADLGGIRGDFVASLMSRDKVVLLRSLDVSANLSLFYRVVGRSLIWSTNYVDLVRPIADIDFERLSAFAWGASVNPYPDVQVVRPGTFVKFTRSGIETGTFDDIGAVSVDARMSITDWGPLVRDCLTEAVKRRVRQFKRVGVMLSGGIDSAGIVRCLVDIGADVTCYNVAAFSRMTANESDYASAVCDYLGVPLRIIDVSSDGLEGSGFINHSWRFRTPHNHIFYGWWTRLVELAREEVDCLVSGHGGDGVFSGPFATRDPRDLSTLSRLRQTPLRHIPAILGHSLSLPRFRDSGLLPVGRQADSYTSSALKSAARYREVAGSALQSVSQENNLVRPNGLVELTPYFDKDLLALSQVLPFHNLAYGGQLITKPVLRSAFLGLLPSEVVSRTQNPVYADVPQEYCVNNRDLLRSIIHRDSWLVRLGVVDHPKFSELLSDDDRLRINAESIGANCLTSLWLDAQSEESDIRSLT